MKVLEVRRNTARLDRLARELPDKLARIVAEEAAQIAADAVGSMGASPSAPGEPPGIDTGTLAASVGAQQVTQQVGRAHWQVTADAPYAAALEFGVPGRIAARPFLRPAARRAAARFARRAREVLR